MSIVSRVLGAGSSSAVRRYRREVDRIGALEDGVHALSDDALLSKTAEFKERLAKGESLRRIRPEAFAVAREASVRATGRRPYDVQLIAGLVLDDARIAELGTGEGKTLAAVAPAYLNAISGDPVHIVTVNDYLAGRDAADSGRTLALLGMRADAVLASMRPEERRPAYAADVTYGTNTEFGFDYLRDNLVQSASERVQRGHAFAIVDEVDSVLIDEARTPLIISGRAESQAGLYARFAAAVRGIKPGRDVDVDLAHHTATLTDDGIARVTSRLGANPYEDPSGVLVNMLNQAVKAECLFRRNRDYLVRDGEVLIVDEFTGRVLEGREYSDGLHRAIEAKEGIDANPENQTIASVTIQNFFRLYGKLSGMTGTAATEATEFNEIYGLDVVVVPPNRPNIRNDRTDRVFATKEAKWRHVMGLVAAARAEGRPVLVGTGSVEDSETVSRMLDRRCIPHATLNAKNDANEAQLIASAGREGHVTVATNMAGRGTDIMLGGMPADRMAEDENLTEDEAKRLCSEEHDRICGLGGLLVVGTCRHESRRVDNQLRGRAGRQGDPGETVFCISLEDDVMKAFGAENMARASARLTADPEAACEPIESKAVAKAVERAQRRCEDMAFAVRKNVVDYDDVIDRQRRAIYGLRDDVLDAPDTESVEHVMLGDDISKVADITKVISDAVGPASVSWARRAALIVIDRLWHGYMSDMDRLREGIGLRGVGQRDPLVEYREEAYGAFNQLTDKIAREFAETANASTIERVE